MNATARLMGSSDSGMNCRQKNNPAGALRRVRRGGSTTKVYAWVGAMSNRDPPPESKALSSARERILGDS
jgi:hypothetical protein